VFAKARERQNLNGATIRAGTLSGIPDSQGPPLLGLGRVPEGGTRPISPFNNKGKHALKTPMDANEVRVQRDLSAVAQLGPLRSPQHVEAETVEAERVVEPRLERLGLPNRLSEKPRSWGTIIHPSEMTSFTVRVRRTHGGALVECPQFGNAVSTAFLSFLRL
jgi:hypothetical protein